MKKSANTLTGLHSHTSSVWLIWSSLATLLALIHEPQLSPSGQCGPFSKGLELPIKPAMPYLALDHWVRSGTTKLWSRNCLSLSAELTGMEHARRNSNVHHRTSHIMMILWKKVVFQRIGSQVYQFTNGKVTQWCGSYTGIKLLEHAMKVVKRMFEYRIQQQIEIDDMQFGFMKGKGTTDAIFIVRQMQRILELKERNVILALWIWKKNFW